MPLIKRSQAMKLGGALGAIALITTGCATSGGTDTSSTKDAGITVWLDANRLATGQAYAKLHPELDIRIVTVDKSTVLSKISWDSQAKSGWPGLVWPGDPATIGNLASKQITFIRSWEAFFLPFVMLSDDRTYTLQIGLKNLLESTGAINPTFNQGTLPIHSPEAALAGLLTVAPILLVFLFAQRFLVSGQLSGSEKG